MKAQITGTVAVVALFLNLLSPWEATGQFVGGKSTPPNIVLILADDLGWMDVGYNGAEFYETPNIHHLASEGMVFSRFYPSAANCAPTLASLLTGTAIKLLEKLRNWVAAVNAPVPSVLNR